MSYILDALRKAERERRAQRVPTLETVHVPESPVRWRAWPWVSAGALGVGAVMLAVLLRSGPSAVAPRADAPRPVAAPVRSPGSEVGAPPEPGRLPPARAAVAPSAERPLEAGPSDPGRSPPRRRAPDAAPAPAAAPQASVSPATSVVPSPAAPGTAPAGATQATRETPDRTATGDRPSPGPVPRPVPGPAGSPDAVRATPVAPGAAPGGSAAPPRAAAPTPTAPPRPTSPPSPPAGSSAPSAPVVMAPPAGNALREAVAKLRLDVLVYSEQEAERMVFINGRKYVERQAVDGQILLESITREGAVLSHEGERVLLRPRLNPYVSPRP